MKVLYDHQIFSGQVYGGISRYFSELMNSFYKNKNINFDIPITFSNNHYLENVVFSDHKAFFKDIKLKGKYNIINYINNINSKRYLLKRNFDIFHPTYYDPYFIKYIDKKPFVLTIYDMIHELYPELFSKKNKTHEWKKLLAQKADKIIAISKNTKNDILKFYDIDKNKIEVIYLGNSLEKNDDFRIPDITLPDNFLLFVGDRLGYKNFGFFIRSIAPLLKDDASLYVVCAGGGKFSGKENNLINEQNIKNKVLQYSVDDRILSYLYQKALVFVFPSLYEGFGIPVLESFSCGCPIALSKTSSLPEVAGDAALYFNPVDEFSIRETISKIIYREEIRKGLQLKGFKQLEKFSWEKTAKETVDVYRSMI